MDTSESDKEITVNNLNDNKSRATARRIAKTGTDAITPPYANNFGSEDNFKELQLIDSNDDDIWWGYNSYFQYMSISAHWQHAMDDWAVTPALALEAGKKYPFSVKARGGKDGPTERIEIKYGTGNTTDKLSQVLVAPTEMSTSDWIELTGELTPGEDGNYYIGLHAISDADSYELCAKDIKIGEGISEISPVSPITPPYTNNFGSEDNFKELQLIDGNDDDIWWGYNSYFQYMSISAHWQHAMDDWAVTPAFALEAGKKYEVRAKVKGGKDGPTERLEVKYGKTPDADGMTISLIPTTEFSTSDWIEIKGSLEPREDGTYYIGFHAISDADTYELCLKDIQVSTGEDVEPPVTALTPPYKNYFDTDADFEQCTVIDANNDQVTWDLISFLHNLRISYNSQLAMDDWVVTPPLMLEAGKAYKLSAKSKAGNNNDAERIEIKYGEAPTVEGMTKTLVGPTDLTSSEYVTLSEYIRPDKTGIYYIGFHGISDPDTYQLHLDDITIDEGILATVPGVPSDFTVTPDPNGEFRASISVKTPSVDFEGTPLSDKITIEIKRGGTLVHRAVGVQPGSTVTCEDVLTKGGRITYAAYALNASGTGNPVETDVHIGYSFPAAVESVTFAESDSEPGMVTLSWPEVTKDDNGLVYPPGKVSYLIYVPGDYGWNLTYRDITTTSHTFRAVEPGKQTFVSYAVCGLSEEGQGDFAFSGLLPAGTPYKGFSESFTEGTLSYPMITQVLANNGMEWKLYSDESGIVSQDTDNGFLGAKASQIGDASAITSPKISLQDIPSPTLTFYTYNFSGNNNEPNVNTLAVEVREPGGEYTALLTGEVDGLCNGTPGWGRVTADLSAYAGKVIQFRIVATCKIFDLTLLDNIRLDNSYAKDLSLTASAPVKANAGDAYTIKVTVRNEGQQDIPSYRIVLNTDGNETEHMDCTNIAVGSKQDHVFTCNFHPVDKDPVTHSVRLVVEDDMNTDNNISDDMTVIPVVSKLPHVTDLKGEAGSDGISLNWNSPDLSGETPKAIAEDFETFQSWTTEPEGWKFIDNDRSPVGGFKDMTLPGIKQQSLQSFFVFDTDITANRTFAAHSGKKYLASLFRSDQGTVDDWAISPLLSGHAQTVTFHAMSYSPTFAEEIEVYYSTSGTEISDFTKVMAASSVPGDWTRYEVNLPEGAEYFAIRSCGTDTFMLMLDDFTFDIPVSSSELSLSGYNIYRNRERLNGDATAVTSYLDSTAPEGTNKYVVTAVYKEGESSGSNEIELKTAGISLMEGGISIIGTPGRIIISGAQGKQTVVTNDKGIVTFSGIATEKLMIESEPAVYVVRIGRQTTKVVVN